MTSSCTAEARVASERADRYLTQLCDHLDAVASEHAGTTHAARKHRHGGAKPPRAMSVERTADRGTITFADGTCELVAKNGFLELRLEAVDEAALAGLQASFAHRLEQIGRRDRLTVAWTPA